MRRQEPESNKRIELASIASLVAIFVFAELNYSVFEKLAANIASTYPGLGNYSFALVMGGWIGLLVYTMCRRREARRENRARIAIEADFELNRIRDATTGLPNWRGFELVLEERIARSRQGRLYLVGCEVRNMDTISGVHGIQAVADLKIAIARKLTSLCETDDFAACCEHPAFFMIVPASDADEGRFRVDGLIEEMAGFASTGIAANGANLQVGLVFGMIDVHEYQRTKPDATAAELTQRLEFALSRALTGKSGGVVPFTAEMETALKERADIEQSLGSAIRNGEIVPYFQPFIDLTSNRVTGFEILARWEKPHEGIIGPTSFIPVAEDMGLLRSLTLSLLRRSCIAARNWPLDIKLAINISPTDLRDEKLADEIVAILQETSIAPQRIELEITENAIVEEAAIIAATISRFKENGMSISIDDFGTGYSSLHHLRILPFDKIKIDQSFIKDIAHNPDSHAIVQTVIALGESLGLHTTAEGIEAAQNSELLAQLGCTIGQGYLYAKPLPADEVGPFLARFEREAQRLSQVA